MISILLMSDIHFGSKALFPYIDDTIRLATFQRICMLAREHNLFIIAGDLFEDAEIHSPIFHSIVHSLQTLLNEGVAILYVPGEAELENPHCHELIKEIPSTITFYGRQESYYKDFEFYNGIVCCYGGHIKNDNDIAAVEKANRDGFHIGIFHAGIQQNDNHANSAHSISAKLLRSLPLDYYAFGHHHNFSLYKYKNRIIGAYPGSPEAVSFNEGGDRYVLSISIENNEIHQIKRIAVNSIKIEAVTIQCDRVHSLQELSDIIKPYNDSAVLLCCTLEGSRSFDVDSIREICSNAAVLIVDHSMPAIEYLCAKYKEEHSLRGYFFNEMNNYCNKEFQIHMQEIIGDIENTCLLHKGKL